MRSQLLNPTFKDLEVVKENSKLVPSSQREAKLPPLVLTIKMMRKIRRMLRIQNLIATVIVIAKEVDQTVKVMMMLPMPLPPRDSSKDLQQDNIDSCKVLPPNGIRKTHIQDTRHGMMISWVVKDAVSTKERFQQTSKDQIPVMINS